MDYSGLGYDALLKQYKLLVERANKRLLRLERSGQTGSPAYRAVVHSGAKASARASGGKIRFTKSNPKNERVLRARMNAVQSFLEAPTSTQEGYRELKKTYGPKVAATLRKEYGLDLTGDQIDAVFDSSLWEYLDGQFASETAIQVIASIQKGQGDVGRTMKSIGPKRLNLSEGQKETIKKIFENKVRGPEGEWIDADRDMLNEIEGFFKGK